MVFFVKKLSNCQLSSATPLKLYAYGVWCKSCLILLVVAGLVVMELNAWRGGFQMQVENTHTKLYHVKYFRFLLGRVKRRVQGRRIIPCLSWNLVLDYINCWKQRNQLLMWRISYFLLITPKYNHFSPMTEFQICPKRFIFQLVTSLLTRSTFLMLFICCVFFSVSL